MLVRVCRARFFAARPADRRRAVPTISGVEKRLRRRCLHRRRSCYQLSARTIASTIFTKRTRKM